MKHKTLKTPAAAEEWKDKLRSFSMRIGFTINLSRAMMEFLCAVADGVEWDRMLYRQANGNRENFIVSSAALVKRGLVEHKGQEAIRKEWPNRRDDNWGEWSNYKLTPAGKCIVNLLKMAGMFIEADAAITKKNRRA